MKERSGMPYDVVAFETDELALTLTEGEEGIFHRMLRKSWINGSVPADIDQLASLCRIRPSTLRKAWPRLSKMWHYSEENSERLQNKKQESERIFLESKRHKNSIAGKLSAKSKKDRVLASTNVKQESIECSTPLPSPPQPNSKGDKENIQELREAFAVISKAYPNGDGRAHAEKRFMVTVKTAEDVHNIGEALKRYLAWLRRNADWLKPKNFKTWMNNWTDWLGDTQNGATWSVERQDWIGGRPQSGGAHVAFTSPSNYRDDPKYGDLFEPEESQV